ncbi:hypothetical protein [Reyranella sp. CPCC 100927]|uniref:hypothetical protein n=1 Tax=Reyranella sp. CPCC 100927 TaxID=2599616 RepID=UPI0011B6ABB2|nr:hypothetical protein [Reyranella sp. CPCC 100927]TWS94688.1 hypothetical protein FQU96_40910 [Reyranella sp. CPCC 100927]
MSAAFDAWLRETYAATKGFTALLLLVKTDARTIWPLGSSYANVIGNELTWSEFRRLLDRSDLSWNAVAIFPAAAAAGGPLNDTEARARLKQVQDRVIANHAAVNEGVFFDRKGRPLRLDPLSS